MALSINSSGVAGGLSETLKPYFLASGGLTTPAMCPDPLSQFFQVGHIHTKYKFLPVNIVNRQNVIFGEIDVVTMLESMQPCLHQRIVHHRHKECI